MDLFYHKRYSLHFEFSETKEAVISTLIYEDCAIKKITYRKKKKKKQLSDIEIFFSNGERSKWNADKLDLTLLYRIVYNYLKKDESFSGYLSEET